MPEVYMFFSKKLLQLIFEYDNIVYGVKQSCYSMPFGERLFGVG